MPLKTKSQDAGFSPGYFASEPQKPAAFLPSYIPTVELHRIPPNRRTIKQDHPDGKISEATIHR